MSWISWVMTSNDASRLNDPLRSRCRLIRMRDQTPEELVAFIEREGARRKLSEASIGAAADAFVALTRRPTRTDLRDVGRILDYAESLQNRTTLN